MANETLIRNEEIVDGKYRLGDVISQSIRGTVCETELGGAHVAPIAAVIKIREIDTANGKDGEDSEGPIQRWRSAIELAHPNLLKIYAAGSSMLNDFPVAYAVMERADESLEGVLQTRPLTGEETREIVVSAAAALRFLHKKGYAHSRLRPSNVLAVGDRVKLSTDSAIRISEGASAEEDMRALGTLIVQVLTQQAPHRDGDSEAEVPEELPEPLRQVAQRCLNPDPFMRWTAEEVLARLGTPEIEPPLPTWQPQVESIPVVEAQADVAGEEEIPNYDKSTKGIPRWIYAALAVVVLIVFLLANQRKNDAVQAARIPAVAAEQAPPEAVPAPAPLAAARPAPRVGSAPTVAPITDRKAEGWSVIVAAYAAREPAEKRMHEMAKRWPRFNPSVFQPQTGKTHYIVVLGQNLSEDAAQTLRKRAVAAGLPRDTYIKRVM